MNNNFIFPYSFKEIFNFGASLLHFFLVMDSQCTDSRKKDCTHFASFVCSSCRDSSEMVFWPPSGQTFLKVLNSKLFVRMRIIVFFCAILRRSVSTHQVIMVASGQTHRMPLMLTSDVSGNSFGNGTLSSILLPVSGSQVSGRKSVVSFDTYSGSHATVSDEFFLDTPKTSRNKKVNRHYRSALLLTVLRNVFGCTTSPILGHQLWWDQRSAQ